MDEEEHQGFDYTVCFDSETVLFRDGFSVPISSMFDEFGEETLDLDEAAVIVFKVGEKRITFNLKEWVEDFEAGVFDEPEH